MSHFTWLLKWFIILDMNNLVNYSHHYWMLLKLSIKLKSTWAAKWGTAFSNKEGTTGYSKKFGHKSLYEPLYWNSELWRAFSHENTPEELTGTHTSSFFFIKTSNWEKWWSWWLRMTNAFILCNLLWKVKKRLAVNREGSFNCIASNLVLKLVYPVKFACLTQFGAFNGWWLLLMLMWICMF